MFEHTVALAVHRGIAQMEHEIERHRRQQFEAREQMLRHQYEMERLSFLARLDCFDACGASDVTLGRAPAAPRCSYCGRPAKATACRGDGCEGCGAALEMRRDA